MASGLCAASARRASAAESWASSAFAPRDKFESLRAARMLQLLQEQGRALVVRLQGTGVALDGPGHARIRGGHRLFPGVAAQLFLRTKPDDVAWFWPAAGVASGVLIAIGSGAKLPVAIGTMVASVPGNLLDTGVSGLPSSSPSATPARSCSWPV
jgi:hypothetical protein